MPKSTRTLRDPNRKPTHPGAILREDFLPALRMTQTEFAQRLCVSRGWRALKFEQKEELVRDEY